jgi:para-aminobenzoate synthetase component 1
MNITYSPLFEEIPFSEALRFSAALDRYNHIVFFNSTRVDDKLGRYSFIALDPFEQFIYEATETTSDIFEQLTQKMDAFILSSIPELPPFQGGAAGYLSYDLVRDLEVLPHQAVADTAYPKFILGFYDVILSMDHVQQKAWIVSSGFPEQDVVKRQERAQCRLRLLPNPIITTVFIAKIAPQYAILLYLLKIW